MELDTLSFLKQKMFQKNSHLTTVCSYVNPTVVEAEYFMSPPSNADTAQTPHQWLQTSSLSVVIQEAA